MSYPEHYHLGKLVKTHGVKGDLILVMDTDTPERYRKMKTLFIEDKGSLVEYTVSTVVIQPDDAARIHLTGVDDMTAAERFLKKQVYMPLSFLPPLRGKQFYFHEVIGFEIVDEILGSIGVLANVFELPQHPVGGFQYKGKEALFPMSDDFLVKIDRKEKKIFTRLPEGLLSVYE